MSMSKGGMVLLCVVCVCFGYRQTVKLSTNEYVQMGNGFVVCFGYRQTVELSKFSVLTAK